MRLLLCLLGLGLVACPEALPTVDDDPGCVLDSECGPGELCMEGDCIARPDPEGCSQNADCDLGLVCRARGCESAPTSGTCNFDDDCAFTDRCTTGDGDCLPSEQCAHAEPGALCHSACYGHCVDRPACDDDGDCSLSEQCADLRCQPIGDCSADGDCPDDAACIEGVCNDNGDCTDDVDCPTSQSCVGGECTRNEACVDSACPSDQRCVDGQCLRRAGCAGDDDCGFDESCVDGTCNGIGSCDDVDDCPAEPGVACLEGVCSRAPCGRDSECDDSIFCNGAETCDPRVGCADGPAPGSSELPTCVSEVCDEARKIMVRSGSDELCGDGSPCTDDLCDVDVGCLHPANTFSPDPGPGQDCGRIVCTDGSLTTVADDDEIPADQGSPSDCYRAVCSGGARILVVDEGETPPQGPDNDCRHQRCQEGAVVTVDDDGEVPPQGPGNDCVREVCSGGSATSTADDGEVPLQGPPNDCRSQVCAGGVVVDVPHDVEIPPQGPINDCIRQTCSGGNVIAAADDTETPLQRSTADCTTQSCSGGAVVDVPANETLAQLSPTDCLDQLCSNGGPINAPNNAEVPPQTSSTDCTTQTCSGGLVVNAANNAEIPAQVSLTDCKRQVCSGGVVVVQNNDSEVPADVGCKEGACSGGAPTLVRDDGNCTDSAVCTLGSCNVDGSCTQVPDDDLCHCTGSTQVGLCLPGDARAPTSGSLAGCVCLTPAVLSCGTDDGVFVKKVLQRFELNATATGLRAGSTFVWDLVGTPVGADPAAQLLGNATNQTTAFFQATTASAVGVRDYVLRVTLQEPELPPQSCDVKVEAQKLVDKLEVSLFMNASIDVDLHLISGAGATFFDFPFHEDHDPALDNSDHDCYYFNCPVCTVSVPGQSCVAVSPRVVDYDDPVDGAALADKQDPQLDIDNQRGCFTAANGDLQCIPEKITVELPTTGTYRVFPYLWGNALTVTPGLASTPSSTTVTIQITCRDVTRTITRTLSSIAADGTTATSTDPVRYGDPLFITVPASGACTLP